MLNTVKFPVRSGKTMLIFFVICNLIICNLLISQNITNTLGTSGMFTLKDNVTTYLSLSQSTGYLSLNRGLVLSNTTSSTIGVVYKGTDRFIHNYGTDNTFMGINSGNFTMTGNYNTAQGNQSLTSNTTGSYNTALGSESLWSNNGDANTAVGFQTLYSNSTGIKNTAVGMYSLYNNSGNNNTAVGNSSLEANTTGSNNTAIGLNSLNTNSIGSHNTALGFESGLNITTGINNIAIGFSSTVPSGNASHQVRIGNVSITYAGIQVPWTITSDRRWKSDVQNSNLGLGFISKLRPVSYYRNSDEYKRLEYGLIAQEVEEVLKESGIENSGMLTITDKGMYELRYNDLLAPMVKAIQELKAENDKLKAEIENMKTIEVRLAKLELIQIQQNNIKEIKLSTE